MTPYEKFRSLPEAEDCLKPGTTLEKLDALAAQCSDNDAAQCLNEVRAILFQSINKSQQSAVCVNSHKPPSLSLMSGLENTAFLRVATQNTRLASLRLDAQTDRLRHMRLDRPIAKAEPNISFAFAFRAQSTSFRVEQIMFRQQPLALVGPGSLGHWHDPATGVGFAVAIVLLGDAKKRHALACAR